MVRHGGRTRDALRVFLMLPLLLPEIITAIALLFFVYATGIGTRTMVGLVIGHVLITLPYVFTNVASALYNHDTSTGGSRAQPRRHAASRPFGA